ncbi:alpha-L-rhamnosidase-related protein [Paenibacillus nasutitermitis]|uniref:Alpha-L-rhamnosidase n=1 Tax=Paenibacillus nasutitermitis TaxID=1652958 RepID=A0A916ZBA3_9BACL|nr:alpha-L-rhamnosidase N-terminal domain-containing protein [Paenibacillus nasutitermitis]GGD84557.1 hypothetical protein GCM10010911_48620 [Paenibacillus nasutitermitis]
MINNKPSNWEAKWIWPAGDVNKPDRYAEFRGTIQVPEGMSERSVLLHVSARTEYMLYVNGMYIGRGPSPCDSRWQYYDTYEIADELLQSGELTIAAVVYHFGTDSIVTHQMQGSSGFLLQLEVEGGLLLATDESWKCRISNRWGKQAARSHQWGGYNEVYRAVEEDDWQLPGYDDSAWGQAQIVANACEADGPWPRLIAREIPFLHTETVFPESVVRTEHNFGVIKGEASLLGGSYHNGGQADAWVDASVPGSMPGIVYDFGREVVGRPKFHLQAPAGGVLRIAYGESLELQYLDTYILKPGINRLSPFGRRAARFIQLTFMAAPEPVSIQEFSFELSHYPFTQTGYFRSSDKTLDRIWDVSRYTTLMNSHDHLEDCPWREKALWVVDAVVMGKIIYSTFGDTALLRKCLLQGARIQNEDGSIPGTGPESNPFLLPDFCAYWLLGVQDYWKYSGDLALVEELWPHLVRLIDWFGAQRDETGLFARADREGWWCFIDWTEDVDKRDKVAGISMLHYKSLGAMSAMAEALGHSREAEDWAQQASELRQAIRSQLRDSRTGLFADCIAGDELSTSFTLQTNFLAAWSGVTEPEETKRFLADYYAPGRLPAIKGAFFQHIVLEVLSGAGHSSEGLRLIESFWGDMLSRGATTWWETFDQASPVSTIPSTYQGNTPTYLWEGVPVSLCHAWSASPAYMLPRIMMGIDLADLGSGYIQAHPPLAEADWAEAEYPTPLGPIRVRWEKEGDELSGWLEAPEGIEVRTADSYPLQVRGTQSQHSFG